MKDDLVWCVLHNFFTSLVDFLLILNFGGEINESLLWNIFCINSNGAFYSLLVGFYYLLEGIGDTYFVIFGDT